MARNQGLVFTKQTKKRKWPVFLWLFLFIIFILIAMVLVNVVMNKQVAVEKVSIPILGLPKDLEGFTILHLSDLHGAMLGDNQEDFLSAIEKTTFSAVCITGDVVDKNESAKAINLMIQAIKTVNNQAPIYFVTGDEDPSPITAQENGSIYAPYFENLLNQGVVYTDVPIMQEVNKTRLWFAPKSQYAMDPEILEASYQSQKNTYQSTDALGQQQVINYYINQIDRLKEARKTIKPEDYQIVLSHYPLRQNEFSTWLTTVEGSATPLNGVILSLSGHYNGGQWRLPFLALPIYSPDKGFFPPKEEIMGLSQVGSIAQYISPGIGSSSFYPFPGRFFNPPTLSFITLTGKIL